MKEGKYRGKRKDNGEWVVGYLIGTDVIVGDIVDWDDEYFCTEFWLKVDPETVGQYCNYYGLEFCDKDIISIACDCDSEYGCSHPDGKYLAVWDEETAGYVLESMRSGRKYSLDTFGVENMHVIGNGFEDSDLLEVTHE
ncbi:hypothetical protein P4H66_19535 [Paenibacillus dokdonensis]|uniref:YopX protein domain-containing protein n=1 Tax=Paenibacillus dokdonensis TaxID=2567944 RepID=A0ABU6GQG1_9BACL|nr:hypothetical protein [Paenibacillus dokdonensis]MEC0241999.1 hypothetical protein [Paenibacillus dokdonensis]